MTHDKLVDITVDKDGPAKAETLAFCVDKDGRSGAGPLGITVDKDGKSGAAVGQSRRSVLLIVSLLALSLLAWAATSAYGAGIGAVAGAGGAGAGSAGAGNGATAYLAQVKDGSGNVYRLPLEYDTRLEVRTALGVNIVVVSDGEVFVEEADCPGEDCLRQGGISRPGQTIVCLPHRLVVQIVVASGQGEGGGGPSGSDGNGNTGSGQSGDSAGGNNGSGQGGSNAGTNNTSQQPPIVDAISE